MTLWLLAWRNLRRHPLRTTIKLGGIGLIAAVMLVWGSLTNGFSQLLYGAATGLELGDFQLHAEGYRASQDVYGFMPDAATTLERARSQGVNATARLFGFALAAAGERSAGVRLEGLEPAAEATVTRLHAHVAAGDWLESGRAKEVVVGRTLARQLGVHPGSELVVLGYALDGSLANEVFRVRGILASVTADVDNRNIYVLADDFRELYAMPRGAHEIAFRARGNDSTEATRRRLAAAQLQGELLSWRELKPLLARTIGLQALSAYFTLGFTYLALGGIILNITFMTIYDRMREYGVMQAVGMAPGQLRTMIVAEIVWLAVGAGALALVVGVPVARALEVEGIDFSFMIDRLAFAGVNLEPVLRAALGPKQALAPIAFLLVTMPLFAIYPAREAARLSPVEALRRL